MRSSLLQRYKDKKKKVIFSPPLHFTQLVFTGEGGGVHVSFYPVDRDGFRFQACLSVQCYLYENRGLSDVKDAACAEGEKAMVIGATIWYYGRRRGVIPGRGEAVVSLMGKRKGF